MRMSRFFPYTLHQAPAEAEQASHRLLLRAGLVRSLGAAGWAFLPLGERVRARVRALGRETLTALGGQEIALPVLAAAELWAQAGLSRQQPSLGLSLHDEADRDLLWPRTIEPLLTALFRHDLRSHRMLPLLCFGFRPRLNESMGGGPLGAGQALVMEAFSLQAQGEALEPAMAGLGQACERVLSACGLVPLAAETVIGPEFLPGLAFVDPGVPGEESFARCPACGYAAALTVARRAREAPPEEAPLALEEVHTPDCPTIASLAEFLGVPKSRTAKAILLTGEDTFYFAIVRGDMDLDEAKLARLVRARELRPATAYEIEALGASPGFASPIGIRRAAPEVGLRRVQVVVDELIPQCPNLVAGANQEDTHLCNVNYGRDYRADLVADLVAVREGDPCPHCQSPLELFQSTVLGRVWSSGSRYSEALRASFQDASGQERPWQLSCAEVEVDRLVAACVEGHHDDSGIRWPVSMAPYTLYLLSLGGVPGVYEAAEALYADLLAAGIAVLFDDRDERAGVKFTDADLLGIPLRVAVSKRTLQQQSAEVKRRDQSRDAVQVIPLVQVRDWAEESLAELGQIKS